MLKSKLVVEGQERVKFHKQSSASPHLSYSSQPATPPDWLFLLTLLLILLLYHILSLPPFAFISLFLTPLPSSINLSSSMRLASHSQWPILHQTAQNRNSGITFDYSLSLYNQILSHTLSNCLSHQSFLLMSHNHHLRPDTSWISAEVSLPPSFLICH